MEYTPFDPFFVSFFRQFGFNAKNSVFPHSSVCKNYAFAHSSCAVFIVLKSSNNKNYISKDKIACGANMTCYRIHNRIPMHAAEQNNNQTI